MSAQEIPYMAKAITFYLMSVFVNSQLGLGFSGGVIY